MKKKEKCAGVQLALNCDYKAPCPAQMSSSEIKTFKDFLDKINLLPANPKYSNNSSTPLQGTSINPPPSKPTNLTLTLKPLRGDPQALKVSFSESVASLRVKVADLFGITEVDRCRLIRSGKALSDDSQTVESVFGLVSEVQILHVLEKPPVVAVSNDWKSSADHPIWNKIDSLLQAEAGISDSKERSIVIEKFRKSL